MFFKTFFHSSKNDKGISGTQAYGSKRFVCLVVGKQKAVLELQSLVNHLVGLVLSDDPSGLLRVVGSDVE